MKISIETSIYNERRYSKPWVAKVTFDESGKSSFEFGSWVGEAGYEGLLMLEAHPGDVIALGQKDFRKPANSAPDFYIVRNTVNSKIESTAKSDLEKSGIEYVSKKAAFEYFKTLTPAQGDNERLLAEQEQLLARLAEIKRLLGK